MGAISSVNLLQNKIGIDQAKALASILKEHSTLKSFCGNRGDETELDMSGKSMDAGDAIMLAAEIDGNRALKSLNLAKNHLGSRRGKAKYSNPDPNIDNHWECHTDMSGVVAIADISNVGTMTRLNISDNMLCMLYSDGSGTYNGAGVAALSDMLKSNSMLKELKMSKTYIGSEGAKVLSLGLSGNGALLVLDISNNSIGRRSKDGDGEAPWIETPEGPQAIADALKSNVRDIMYIHITSANICHDKGVISSVNLLKNSIGPDQAKTLVNIFEGHPTLKSLCGNQGDETELDMSRKMGGAGDAIMLVAEIIGNEAMSSVNLLENDIGTDQAEALASILKEHPTLKSLCGNTGDETDLDMSGKKMGAEGAIMLAVEIIGNGALTSLHVGQNNIPKKEMKEIMAIAMRMDSMKTLCEVPFKDKTLTKLDVSGKNLGMEGAFVVAEYLDGNRAMTSLNLSSNAIGSEGAVHVAEAIKVRN
jgi:Leucine-rich repeat (LRR) protein